MNPKLRLSPLAAALLLAISTPALADMAPDKSATELDAVEVQGARTTKPASPKYTEALVNTPQTITVVTKDAMDMQGLTSLRDVLSTLPGITFGAGEGGGGYGDKINLRGFDATADITVDGVRDSGLYTRSDNFNLESLELVNGANSAYSGAGSVGGNINLVSKTAGEGDFNNFTVGAGTDNYGRVTADSNFDLENGVAVRLNAMGHTEDVPGRDEEFRHRWGFAPSIAFGLGSDSRLTLSYLHQHDNNLPQYGVPYALNDFNDGPLPGVDRETYFGYRNTSRQEIDVDMLTGVFETDFNDHLSLRSLGRLQRAEQNSNVTALQGTWCRFDGTNPFTGEACLTLPSGVTQPAGTWSPTGGPRGNVRETENFLAYSQTDLTATFNTGAVEHHLVTGVSFSKEDFDLHGFAGFRNPDGSVYGGDNNATYPLQDLDNPYNIWTGPTHHVLTSRTRGSVSNQAVYAFDTITFSPQWLLNLGVRYEHNEGSTKNLPVPGGTLTEPTIFKNEDDLFSYRAGLIYKPVDNASVYLSYANSKTPSKTSVNSACNATTCNVDPETAQNIELGTKWDLLDSKLSLTAAIFRNERSNFKVAADPNEPTLPQVLDGKARVDGIVLGAAGRINHNWSIFANYTFLDSEVLQSVSDEVREDTGIDLQAGDPLPNTPKHSASLWTAYELGKWNFGYGTTYQGSFHPTSNNADTGIETPDYVIHNAMVGYQLNERIGLQLNLKNLADKEYYHSIRNNATNGWAIPGDGRSATLTASFKF